MSMINVQKRIRDALLTVTNKVYHYQAPDGTQPGYIVWAEEGTADAVYADNILVNRAIEGSIDYYTIVEYDPMPEQIEQALTEAGISWGLYSITTQDEHIHYEWTWQEG